MLKCILTGIVLAVAQEAGVAAEKGMAGNYAAYVAGIEMILTDKSLNTEAAALRYRKLREITGISGEEAKKFILRLKNDPAGWQTFESKVMDLIQKKDLKGDYNGKRGIG